MDETTKTLINTGMKMLVEGFVKILAGFLLRWLGPLITGLLRPSPA